MFLGSTKTAEADEIINYVYDQSPLRSRNVVIFAVPKYLSIDGKKVEFSSYKGICNINKFARIHHPVVVEEILSYKNNREIYRDIHHTKYSLLDCILEDRIPKEFILGIQHINHDQKKYNFIENSTHVFEMNKERRENYNNFLANKVKNIGFDANCNNTLEVLTNKTEKDLQSETCLQFDEI